MSGVRVSRPVPNDLKKMKKVVAYIKDAYNELVYKVSWPSRQELAGSTLIVMVASLIIALLVFGVDSLFEWVLNFYTVFYNF